ncbi:MAG: hypothetical protein RR248_05810 [Clostridia bacterium]
MQKTKINKVSLCFALIFILISISVILLFSPKSNVFGATQADIIKIDGVTITNPAPSWTIVDNATGAYYKSNINGVGSGDTTFSFTFTATTLGMFSIDYKVSSEKSYDKCSIQIDGIGNTTVVIVNEVSGEIDWTTVTIPVGAGAHTVSINYKKDVSSDVGEDSVCFRNAKYVYGEKTVTAVSSNPACGTVTGTKTATVGAPVTFTATEINGGVFTGWFDSSGKIVSQSKEFTFNVIDTITYTAQFDTLVEITKELYTDAFTLQNKQPTDKLWLVKGAKGNFHYESDIAGQHNTATELRFEFSGTGLIAFDYMISSEKSWDFLTVTLDGVEIFSSKGSEWFTWQTINCPSSTTGNHVLIFQYKKDGSGSSGEDCVKLRNLRLVSGSSTITAVTNDANLGTATGTATQAVGTSITLTAEPCVGCRFMYWEDSAGNQVSVENTLTVVVIENTTYTAVFNRYAPINTITLTYGSNAISITDNYSVSQDYITDRERMYTIRIADNGNTVTVTHNGKPVTVTNGVYTYKGSLQTSNTIVITMSKTGFADKSITIVTKTDISLALCPDGSLTNITNDPTNPWNIEVGDGATYLNSAMKLNGTTNIISATFSGKGVLVFEYLVSCEKGYDWLIIEVDGKEILKASGIDITTWTSFVHSIETDGAHTLNIKYKKDGSGSSGEDLAKVKNFCFASGIKAVTIASNDTALGTVNTSGGSYEAGKFLSLEAMPTGSNIFLGWYANGTLLSQKLQFKYSVVRNEAVQAVFAKVEGDGTQEAPYNLTNLIASLNKGTLNLKLFLPSKVANIYFSHVEGMTIKIGATLQTAVNNVYTIPLTSEIVVTVECNGKIANITYFNAGLGTGDNSITNGHGVIDSPYIISNWAQMDLIRTNLDKFFKLGNALTGITGKTVTVPTWTSIGNVAATPFTGGFDGNGWTIIIEKFINGAYNGGLFGCAENARIGNFTIIATAKDQSFTSLGAVVSYSKGANLIYNVDATAHFKVTGHVGALIGSADAGAIAENCTARGEVMGNGNTGGLCGNGGTFNSCISYVDVSGTYLAGGFVGGYSTTGTFNNCIMAGTVHISGSHGNNYPYYGIFHGYGAWVSFYFNNTAQRITVTYTDVANNPATSYELYNTCDLGYKLESKTKNADGSTTLVFLVYVEKSTADLGLLNETIANGVTGNYGGYTIRFVMQDGTYKYIGTYNKDAVAFESNFNVDLSTLTSYNNNFATMQIDTSLGLTAYSEVAKAGVKNFNAITGKFEVASYDVSVCGSVIVNNSLDFEHLSWIVNGGIPTVFGSGASSYYYNCRTVATLSIKLNADIDLTSSPQFYGFGVGEMHPYRGCLFGNFHSITVNINRPDAYLVGIINLSSDMTYDVVISNLTVYGSITGGYRVGIVGGNDRYYRSGATSFINVKNYANITAKAQAGGLIGYSNTGTSLAIKISNCVNYGNVKTLGNFAGGFVGDTTTNSGSSITITNSSNFGSIEGNAYVGGFVGSTIAGRATFAKFTNCSNFGIVKAKTEYAGGFIGHTSFLQLDGTNTNYGSVLGRSYVGGIAGRINANGGLKSSGATINQGNIVGAGHSVGGLYGYVAEITSSGISINLGVVKGVSLADYGVGGIVGTLVKGIITNATNYGDVYNTSTAGSAGGVVGNIRSDKNTTAEITNCENHGVIVSLNANTKVGQIVGGIARPTNEGVTVTLNITEVNRKGKIVGIENTATKGT